MNSYQKPFEKLIVLLVLLISGIHLYWGIPRFINYAVVGVFPDPRPLLFVLSGHGILIGLTLVLLGIIDKRWTYLPGMALMVAHLVGYAAWHTVLSHGVSHTTESTPHVHDVPHPNNVAVSVIEHAVNSPMALVSKLAELVVLVSLVWLYLSTRRS